MTRQGVMLVVLGVVALIAYTLAFRSNYAINVGFLILLAAYLGQTWNIAGGFAGQTSFGHVVFFGTGAYTSTILQVTYGWNPWLAWPAAMLAGGIVGWVIAFLSFRAGLRGSYFALITLAFAEVFRILANSVPFTRGGLGMLIKADQRPINFQFKDPIWIYYIALALCVISLLIAWQLTRNRFGARLVAIRENEDAARALGIDVFAEKVKVLTLSGAMCAAGGTFYAQKYLYMADGVNEKVKIIDRQTLEEITTFGDGGRQPGQFYGVHSIAIDRAGNLYTTETYEGKRLQRFLLKGAAPVTAMNQGAAVTWPQSK